MSNNRTPNIPLGIVGAIIGALVGIPMSYFFQPNMVRRMASFSDYMKDFGEMVARYSDLRSGVISSCLVCALVFGIAFALMFKKNTSAAPQALKLDDDSIFSNTTPNIATMNKPSDTLTLLLKLLSVNFGLYFLNFLLSLALKNASGSYALYNWIGWLNELLLIAGFIFLATKTDNKTAKPYFIVFAVVNFILFLARWGHLGF